MVHWSLFTPKPRQAEPLAEVSARVAHRSCDTALPDPHPDSVILSAWERWKETSALYNSAPFSSEASTETAEEEALCAAMDAQEREILGTVAVSPRGAAIQLLCSMLYSADCGTAELHGKIVAEDIAFLTSVEDDFDHQTRMVLAALRSLKMMKG